MSTVFEPVEKGVFVAKNGGNGAGTALRREVTPLGLNAQKVVAKRYAMKNEHGEAIETWADIVIRLR